MMRILAMVSHMPHLIAAILTQVSGGDELGELRMRLSAGGFRDCTRVAGGLPSMWREIIYGNRHNVLEGLSKMEDENSSGKRNTFTRRRRPSLRRLFT